MIIQIAVAIFVLLEMSNVIALYFKPELEQANAMGAFLTWEETKDNKPVHDLLRYMAYWVAGSKLIFISLLLVIVLFASEQVQFYALIVLIISILTYYWKLSPLIGEMDKDGLITPKGYSRTLNMMIATFAIVLSAAAILSQLFDI